MRIAGERCGKIIVAPERDEQVFAVPGPSARWLAREPLIPVTLGIFLAVREVEREPGVWDPQALEPDHNR